MPAGRSPRSLKKAVTRLLIDEAGKRPYTHAASMVRDHGLTIRVQARLLHPDMGGTHV